MNYILTIFTIFIGVITLIIAVDASFGIVEGLVNFGTLEESYKSMWSVFIIWIIPIIVLAISVITLMWWIRKNQK